MSDQGKDLKTTVAEEAKGLAVEVYKDLAKPAVSAVGSALGATAQLLLAPLTAALRGINAVGERLVTRIGQRLEAVPPERRLPAPATIAGPAALQYALLGDGDEVAALREMFENLLLSSMDRNTTKSVHPAFVSMIAQMTPDEAWILKSITGSLRVPIIEVRYYNSERKYVSGGFLCDLGRGIGVDESRQARSFSNLERLGIFDITWTSAINDDSGDVYASLIERMHKETGKFHDLDPAAHKGILSFSVIGYELWKTCSGA